MATGTVTTWVNNALFETNPDNQDEEVKVRVKYTLTPGYPATWDDPGAGSDVDLDEVLHDDTGLPIGFQLIEADKETIREAAEADYENHHGAEDPDDARDRDLDDRADRVGRYAPFDEHDF